MILFTLVCGTSNSFVNRNLIQQRAGGEPWAGRNPQQTTLVTLTHLSKLLLGNNALFWFLCKKHLQTTLFFPSDQFNPKHPLWGRNQHQNWTDRWESSKSQGNLPPWLVCWEQFQAALPGLDTHPRWEPIFGCSRRAGQCLSVSQCYPSLCLPYFPFLSITPGFTHVWVFSNQPWGNKSKLSALEEN